MTDALEYLRLGDPDGALKALQERVRAEPADAKHRVFLFQLLCVLGQWDRALTQLNVAGELDPGTLGMVTVYRSALSNEALRSEVFAGQRSPLIFGDPEQWVAVLLEALRLAALGQYAQSQQLRTEAFEEAPGVAGVIKVGGPDGSTQDQPFEWIADADLRLGPVFEAIINGRYYWIPMHRIAEVRLEAPEDLRDLVWARAQFKWANEGEAVGLVPVRYPGSEASADPTIRLSRKTEWQDVGEELFLGCGQKMLTTDAGDYPLMEVRSIVLTPSSEQ